MILVKKKSDLQFYLRKLSGGHRERIGFVPTMGALHPGHLSLIEQSRKDNSITVCSIFVNPAQFNDPSDYQKYPITIEKDIRLLEQASCDLLFLPAVDEIYPSGFPADDRYELGNLETILEGQFRPGHFQGVCKVVKRLLEAVEPGHLYLGQKDYQQCMVITRLVDLMGERDKIHIHISPTLREADGLAMSSRNMRLSPQEREMAPALFRSLQAIRRSIKKGDVDSLKGHAWQELSACGFRPDYIEIADAGTLEIVHQWDGNRKIVALVAAFLQEVRLIDNLVLNG